MKSRVLFGKLFFGLKQAGVPVSLQEWMTLMEALAEGVIAPDLKEFYAVGRSLLVKDESYFDLWDQVFAAVFHEGEMPTTVAEELMEWLTDPQVLDQISPEQLASIEDLSLDELMKLFEERLKEQTERHDGGNRWIGTGGTSPFGHGGIHPDGLRVGGRGKNRSAAQIAGERRFRDYRNDRVLDTRAMGVALKKLRRLSRTQGPLELNIDKTVDETCRDGGELNLVFEHPRKNEARVLLLMDVGGSMEPYARRVESLFSAANQLDHWKQFDAFQFHNCPYSRIYTSMTRYDGIPTGDLLTQWDKETFLIFVGDAAMAPSELSAPYGAISYGHQNQTPGIVWLHRLRSRFQRTVWLNPIPERWWGSWSTWAIRQLYPMFPLTVGGIEEAVNCLTKSTPAPVPPLNEKVLQRRRFV